MSMNVAGDKSGVMCEVNMTPLIDVMLVLIVTLIMTAIGLAVAVPAVMGYNWLIRRNKQVMDQTKAFAGDLHNVLIAGKR